MIGYRKQLMVKSATVGNVCNVSGQTKLMNDDSFTDPIPSNQADFVALVTARSDYKNRKARDDASS
jgi:hypothetical protein